MAKITAEQIKEWKAKYGTIKKIVLDREVETQTDPKTGKEKEVVVNVGKLLYLKKPDRATIKYAMAKSFKADQTVDAISPGEIILKKCWLGGDEEINTDDKYYFRACIEANRYLNEVTGFL